MVSRITVQDLSILLIILIIINILSKSLLYARMHFSPVWLCNPMDYSPPGPSVHGILQARVLEWVVISSSGDLPHPRIEPTSHTSPALAGRFFTTAAAAATKSLQSCLTLCNPIDGSPLGSSVPGILQARILEWVSISFSSATLLYNCVYL